MSAAAASLAMVNDPIAKAAKDKETTAEVAETDSHGAASEESIEVPPLVTGMSCIWLPTIDLMQ